MQTNSNLDKTKLLSALAHGSVFISTLILSIGIPIAILTVSEDQIIKDNAKEAINFHLNVWLIGAIIGVMSFFSFGLAGLSWVLSGLSLTGVCLFGQLCNAYKPQNKHFAIPFSFELSSCLAV